MAGDPVGRKSGRATGGWDPTLITRRLSKNHEAWRSLAWANDSFERSNGLVGMATAILRTTR